MAHVLANTKEMNREEWLKFRKQGIGGSDAAAVAGINPWKSPIQVYMEKTGEIEPQQAGEKAYWGEQLESLVANEFQKRTGKKVRRRNAILQHPDHPFMIANLDRIVVGEKAGFEAKTTDKRNREQWVQGDEMVIPDIVNVQIHHYMAVTGYNAWWVAVLIGGNEFRYKKVERDDELVELLIKTEKEFWTRVENQDPPELDGSEATGELLKQLYPEGKPEEVELPDNTVDLIEKRNELKEKEKELKDHLKEVENKLKDQLGEYEVGNVIKGDVMYQVKWKNISSKRLDTKKLKKEAPDIFEKFANESSYRRFDIKEVDLSEQQKAE